MSNVPMKRTQKPTKIDTFNKNATKIKEALYETGIDIFRWDCLDFAVGLGEAVEPNKKHTLRCSWFNEKRASYSHCGLIWKENFCDGDGCIPTRNEKEIIDKLYQYMFGTSEQKSKWKVEIAELPHTKLEKLIERNTVESVKETVRRFL